MYIEGRMPVEPMISIRKYLYSDSAKTSQAVAVDSESTQALYGFASDVLKCIDQHVLSGEQCAPLRSQLIQLRDGLRLDWTTEEASQAAEAVGRTLAQQKAATQQSAVSQAIEMQHIFAMLNQALIVLAGGNDRSIARLNRIQESVQQACQIEDMVALKFSLSDTVRFVKAEAAHTQESSTLASCPTKNPGAPDEPDSSRKSTRRGSFWAVPGWNWRGGRKASSGSRNRSRAWLPARVFTWSLSCSIACNRSFKDTVQRLPRRWFFG